MAQCTSLIVVHWLHHLLWWAGKCQNTNPTHFLVGIGTFGDPDHFIMSLHANPKSDLSVPLHSDLILGSAPRRDAFILVKIRFCFTFCTSNLNHNPLHIYPANIQNSFYQHLHWQYFNDELFSLMQTEVISHSFLLSLKFQRAIKWVPGACLPAIILCMLVF